MDWIELKVSWAENGMSIAMIGLRQYSKKDWENKTLAKILIKKRLGIKEKQKVLYKKT
jgi:hypothetical protein